MTPVRNSRGVDPSLVRAAVDRARNLLLALQHSEGYWPAAQEPEVGIDAEDMLFRELMGIRAAPASAGCARWLRSQQRSDGSWARSGVGQGDLAVSVLAYIALRLAGDSADAYHLALAAGWIRDAGGLDAAGIRAQIWLAMIGEVGWDELVVPPPEAIYLPVGYPVRIPGQASWGRPTVIPIAVIAAIRPLQRLTFNLAELRVAAPALEAGAGASSGPRGRGGPDWTSRAYELARDACLAPDVGPRAAALRKCADWLIAAQQPDGSFRASGTGWLLSLLALRLLGHRLDHPVLASGLVRLEAAVIWTQQPDGQARRLAVARPTALGAAQAVSALADAGLAPADEALIAGGWLLAEEASIRAGWLIGLRELTGQNAGPELTGKPLAGLDSAAAAIAALSRVQLPAGVRQRSATLRTLSWLAGLQRKDGGWCWPQPALASALTTRIVSPATGELPDPASAELTGYVLLALAAAGQSASQPARRAVTWLLRCQLAAGPWPDADGAADLAATCAVVPALVAAGVAPTKPPVSRAAQWLVQRQHQDGSWSARPLDADAQAAPPGGETEPTARALLALVSADGAATSTAIELGAAWLTLSQRPDGSWDDQHCGSMAALTASTSALARFLAASHRHLVPGQRQADRSGRAHVGT